MNDIRIVTPIGEITLSKTIGFGVKISIDDLTDITKKNSSYSKTITVPGSKENNRIFGSLFNVNVTNLFFNRNKKIDAKLVKDGIVIIDGFIQLLDVKVLSNNNQSGNLVQYSIKVSDKVIDFYTSIKDKKLDELDFSEHNHTLNRANVINTWDNHTFEDIYIYPLLHKGSKEYQTDDMKPAIFMKAYLLKIAEEAGYSLGGSFMDNESFEKEVVPFNGNLSSMLSSAKEKRKFSAGSSGIGNGPSLPLIGSGNFTTPATIYTHLTVDNIPPYFDNNNNWNAVSNEWYPNVNGNFNLTGNLPFKVEILASGIEFPFLNNEVNANVLINISLFKNGSTKIHEFTPPLINKVLDKNGVTKFFFDCVINAQALDFKSTDYIRIVYAVQGAISPFIGPPVSISTRLLDGATFKNEPNLESLTDGDEVIMNASIPKFKQGELFDDIVKRYNLIVRTDRYNDKKLLLTSRDDYYNEGLSNGILDWTDKFDHSSQASIKLLSSSQNKELLFSYTKASDTENKRYSEQFVEDVIYGEKKLEIDNDFAKDKSVKKVLTKLSPTPLVYNSTGAEMIVSSISTKKPKGSLRVLYWGGYKPTLEYSDGTSKEWSYESWTNGLYEKVSYTTYPYFGHFDDPINPSLDLNWGDNLIYFYNEINSSNLTDNNLFNAYWRNAVNQIIKGKIYTCKLHLTTNDIGYIKYNLNSTIWIKDAYYYISNIIDYNPVGDGLTKVELIKKVDGVKFIPKSSGVGGTDEFDQFEDSNIKTQNDLIWRSGSDGGTEGNGGTEDLIKNNNSVISPMTVVTGLYNIISNDSEYAQISGENHIIESNSPSAMIMGGSGSAISPYNEQAVILASSDSKIESNSTKSLIMNSDGSTINANITGGIIIGKDNVTITQDNEVWIGNLHIVNGVAIESPDIMRGGYNEVRDPFSSSPIMIVRSGYNEVRDPFTESPIMIIRGGYDSL